jgi:hypothetical protein
MKLFRQKHWFEWEQLRGSYCGSALLRRRPPTTVRKTTRFPTQYRERAFEVAAKSGWAIVPDSRAIRKISETTQLHRFKTGGMSSFWESRQRPAVLFLC